MITSETDHRADTIATLEYCIMNGTVLWSLCEFLMYHNGTVAASESVMYT